MTWHVGRLIDHVHLRTRDIARSRAFYAAALGTLGIALDHRGDDAFSADELYVSTADPGLAHTHVHLAFQAPDRATVERFYTAALGAGGTDNGGPGERAYHPGYYACFVLDPDGNNIEAVFHGPSVRSAQSITIEQA